MLDLFERTGIRSIAIFSRGNPDDAALPYCADSDDALNFFQEVLGISPYDLLRRFEQWSCNQDEGMRSVVYTIEQLLTWMRRNAREK